jgi:hypothetical protein
MVTGGTAAALLGAAEEVPAGLAEDPTAPPLDADGETLWLGATEAAAEVLVDAAELPPVEVCEPAVELLPEPQAVADTATAAVNAVTARPRFMLLSPLALGPRTRSGSSRLATSARLMGTRWDVRGHEVRVNPRAFDGCRTATMRARCAMSREP